MPDDPTRSAGSHWSSAGAHSDGDTPDVSVATVGIVGDATGDNASIAPAGYELLEVIGSGGMGVVYRASELAMKRHVAIKILHDRFAVNSPAAARFVEEAQITGQLQHPGIPPVHQVGTLPDGRPFLVMKLIKGSTLEDLKDRADTATDRGRFLAVFEQVCQAVACAHDRKVIHRDLKPANVMVGAFGEVQVMDWGLAKKLNAPGPVTDASTEVIPAATEIRTLRESEGSFTLAGSVLGTPSFMPPEQAGGEIDKIDERSDVFGLGAILCVILTGKPVYVAKDSEAVRLMAIRGQLDECLARLNGCGAEPELVALCKRCLAADPSQRPRHAGEVAKAVADLRTAADERARQAELDRVKAEGDRAAAELRLAEQRKRRKVQAALGLTFTGLIVVGGAFAWWAQNQQRAKDSEARERRNAAEREVSLAVEDAAAKFGRANGAGRDLALWAEARAAALQAQVRATEADAAPEVHDRIRRLLADIEQLEKNRRLVATLLEIQAGMGDTLTPLGDQDFAGADARYRRAFSDYGADLFALSPEDGAELLRKLGSEVRVDLAAAIDDWAYVRYYVSVQKLDDLARLFQVTRLLDPDALRNRIRALIAARDAVGLNLVAEEIDPAIQPVQTVNLVSVYLYLFQPDGHKVAVRFLRNAQPHHPGDFQINHNLAFFLMRDGLMAEALPYILAAIAVRPKSAAAWQDYTRAMANMGRDKELIAVRRRLCDLAPRNLPNRFALAALLRRTNDLDGAAVAHADGIRVVEEVLRSEPDNSRLHLQVGNILWANNETARAEACYLMATQIDPKYAMAFTNLGDARRVQGDADAAIPLLREAVRLDPKVSRSHFVLGLALLLKRDFDGAVSSFLEMGRLAPKKSSDASFLKYVAALRMKPNDASSYVSLGSSLVVNEPIAASILYREAIRLDPEGFSGYHRLSVVLVRIGDVTGALAAAREGVRVAPSNAVAHHNLGLALERSGDLDGAIAEFAESVRLDPQGPIFQFTLDNAKKRQATRGANPREPGPPPREVK